MVLSWLAHSLRHPVLEQAHPLPDVLEVALGPEGSLERCIVVYVVAEVDGIDGRVRIVHDAPVALRDDDGEVCGTIAVCRYLGRLWRLYPINPRGALAVDGMLELLASFCLPYRILAPDAPSYEHERAHLDTLEARLAASDTPWMESFDAPTIADVCWHAAMHWLRGRDAAEERPHLGRWLKAMNARERVTAHAPQATPRGR